MTHSYDETRLIHTPRHDSLILCEISLIHTWISRCTSRRSATYCNTLQHTVTHCNTLQHTATHCNTLQHTPGSQDAPQDALGEEEPHLSNRDDSSVQSPGRYPVCFQGGVCKRTEFLKFFYPLHENPPSLSSTHPSTHSPIQRLTDRLQDHSCYIICVAVCCSVLQCVAVCCSVLQGVAGCCSVLQCVAVCCSVLQRAAGRHPYTQHPPTQTSIQTATALHTPFLSITPLSFTSS